MDTWERLYLVQQLARRDKGTRFNGRFSGSLQMSDCFIVPDDGIWPRVALEVGYSETYDRLITDADLLLEGSEGKIGVVILVKIGPLGLDDTHYKTGFVEIHEYDPASGTRKMRGLRKTQYPIPRNHAQQRITLKWEDIVRDNMDLLLLRPAPPPPPPLMLNELRKCVNVGLARIT